MPTRRIPSLNWLRVFEAAARSGSFTGAAQILNMSPAAVSQQIKALEGHLKTALFHRGPRQVTLSDAGASFLPVVRQSLLSVETTAAALFGRSGGTPVTLRAPSIFATAWLTDRLADLEAAQPAIQLNVMGDGDRQGLRLDDSDLQVVFGNPPRNWGDSDRLFGETIYPVARRDIAADCRAPRDLLHHRLIEISTHKASWLQLLQQAGLSDVESLRFRFTDSSEIALALAARGHGIALARAPAAEGRVRQLGLARCCPNLEIAGSESYHLVSPSRSGLSAAAERVRSWLLEASAPFR
ncbi:MAG: transcriptional regulator GcvA [Rhodospirillales bacterium]